MIDKRNVFDQAIRKSIKNMKILEKSLLVNEMIAQLLAHCIILISTKIAS